MALSLSFPSSKADSGQGIFELDDKVGNTEEQFLEESENGEAKTKKAWKSAPSLHLVNKVAPEEKHAVLQQRGIGGGAGCGFKAGAATTGASFIPVPVTRRSEKGSLVLENLINSNSTSNAAKVLPDVTESPQTPFSGDKPCDLLAQLEIVKRQREMESSGQESVTGESDSVDDNGNPVEDIDQPAKKEGGKLDLYLEEPKKSQSDSSKIMSESKPATQNMTEDKAISDGQEGKVTVISEKSPDEPKYFINAAALSEDTFELPPSPAPSPCSSHFNSLSYVDPYPSLCPFVPEHFADKPEISCEEKASNKPIQEEKIFSTVVLADKAPAPQSNISPKESATVRPRVPVSKSFPDIVQTTFSNEEKESHQLSGKNTKDNSDTESLVADSLEELRQEHIEAKIDPLINTSTTPGKPEHSDKPLKAFEQPLTSYGFDPMTESLMGGISAEKPPEAWVIDFNSLSLESDLMEQSARERKSSMGSSNPSSLAFFVNLDDKTESATPKESSETSSLPEKKIFSMFVDLGSEKESSIPQIQTKSSDSESLMSASMTLGSKRSIINKPVVNVMETSGCGLKYPMNRRFPSPIFQHRAAAEASRKAAQMEFHKEREKRQPTKEQFLDSLEPHSTSFRAMGPRIDPDPMIKSQLVDSTSSNRSSLHVANVLDASFTSSLLSSMENSSPAGEIVLLLFISLLSVASKLCVITNFRIISNSGIYIAFETTKT